MNDLGKLTIEEIKLELIRRELLQRAEPYGSFFLLSKVTRIGHYHPGMRDNNEDYHYYTDELYTTIYSQSGQELKEINGNSQDAKRYIDKFLTDEALLARQQASENLPDLERELEELRIAAKRKAKEIYEQKCFIDGYLT